MSVLEGLRPESVFRIFEDISQIPRPSYKEKAISDYLVDFAKERGLEHYRDELYNVIMIKPATAGYESEPPIILQGHMDMVCEKNADKDFDIDTLADEMDISPVDVQALVDLGYIERDLQTYSRDKKGSRQKLAEAINGEVEKLKRNITTYGGVIYSRDKKNDDHQYVFDGQRKR